MDACAAVSTAFLAHDARAHMHAQTHTFVVQVEPMIFLEISTI